MLRKGPPQQGVDDREMSSGQLWFDAARQQLTSSAARTDLSWKSDLFRPLKRMRTKVTVLGSSASAPRSSYASHLASRLNITARNMAQGHASSDYAVAFLDSLVFPELPESSDARAREDLILWEFAINDSELHSSWRQHVIEMYVRRVTELLPHATLGFVVLWPSQAKNCFPWCTGRFAVWHDLMKVLAHYCSFVRAFAVNVDMLAERVFANQTSLLFADRHHPTQAGHLLIAGSIAAHFADVERGSSMANVAPTPSALAAHEALPKGEPASSRTERALGVCNGPSQERSFRTQGRSSLASVGWCCFADATAESTQHFVARLMSAHSLVHLQPALPPRSVDFSRRPDAATHSPGSHHSGHELLTAAGRSGDESQHPAIVNIGMSDRSRVDKKTAAWMPACNASDGAVNGTLTYAVRAPFRFIGLNLLYSWNGKIGRLRSDLGVAVSAFVSAAGIERPLKRFANTPPTLLSGNSPIVPVLWFDHEEQAVPPVNVSFCAHHKKFSVTTGLLVF